MILNSRRASSSINKLTRLVSFPVYQEPRHKAYWETLDGKKDDILLYDRCGRLSSHIRMPKSDLRYAHVWNGLSPASSNQVCGKCKRSNITTSAPTTMRRTRPVTLATRIITTTGAIATPSPAAKSSKNHKPNPRQKG